MTDENRIFASMQIEMTAVLEEMVATVPALPETVPALPETVPASPEIVPASPGSPDARDSTVLGEPPAVVKPGREKQTNAKRKLQTAFGDEATARPTSRSRSRSPSPPLLLLPGAAVDKGKDAADAAVESRKVLRMQMRRKIGAEFEQSLQPEGLFMRGDLEHGIRRSVANRPAGAQMRLTMFGDDRHA